MTQQVIDNPCIDPHANLSDAIKKAALNAGYAIPFITEEAKFAEAQRARLADETKNPNGPIIK